MTRTAHRITDADLIDTVQKLSVGETKAHATAMLSAARRMAAAIRAHEEQPHKRPTLVELESARRVLLTWLPGKK